MNGDGIYARKRGLPLNRSMGGSPRDAEGGAQGHRCWWVGGGLSEALELALLCF